jgi:hypothetical protein
MQVLVSFSIGRYKDEVLCDVVPMHAGHILLGRPWQFDRKAIHDGFKNRHSFVKDNRTITLVPLTPKQVYEDQVKLKRENELKTNYESKSSKKEDEKGEVCLFYWFFKELLNLSRILPCGIQTLYLRFMILS